MSYLLIEHGYYYFKWLDEENKVSENKIKQQNSSFVDKVRNSNQCVGVEGYPKKSKNLGRHLLWMVPYPNLLYDIHLLCNLHNYCTFDSVSLKNSKV